MITAGYQHTCGVTQGHTALCWGSNDDGQSDVATSQQGKYSQVTAGGSHSCAVTTDHLGICWGDNDDGQTNIPTSQQGKYSQVTAGSSHSCAVTTDHIGICWGWNEYGQTDVATSQQGKYSLLTAGGIHSCAVTTDNIGICWGYNGSGRTDIPTSQQGKYSLLTAGSRHSCAVTTDNIGICWGWNSTGQSDVATSQQGKYSLLTAGYYHSCAVTTDNIGICWGWNEYGQTDVATSQQGKYSLLTAGGGHSCAVTTDNIGICWGWNEYGQTDVATDDSGSYCATCESDYTPTESLTACYASISRCTVLDDASDTTASLCKRCETGQQPTQDKFSCVPSIEDFFQVVASPDALLVTLLGAFILFVVVLVVMQRSQANMRFHIASRAYKDILFLLLEMQQMYFNVLFYLQLPDVEHCLRQAQSTSVAGPLEQSSAFRQQSTERTQTGSYAGFAFLNAQDSFAPASSRDGCRALADQGGMNLYVIVIPAIFLILEVLIDVYVIRFEMALLARELDETQDQQLDNDLSFETVWTPRIALLLESLLAAVAIATYFLFIEGNINLSAEAHQDSAECAFVVLDQLPPASSLLPVDYTYLYQDRAAEVQQCSNSLYNNLLAHRDVVASDLASLAALDLSEISSSSYTCKTFSAALHYFEEHVTSTCVQSASFIQDLRMSVRAEQFLELFGPTGMIAS